MTTDSRHEQDEKALDEDIASIRPVWAGRKNEEPPALLDQAVMNRAKRGLDEQGKVSLKGRSIRWLGAFATASVVVLALTVVLEQEQHAPVPAAEQADGLSLDSDAPSGEQRRVHTDAVPQKARTEKMADEPVAGQNLQQSATTVMNADEISAANLADLEESVTEIPFADAWIDQLLELQKTGQLEKLAAELARFRSAYPGYPLPPELDDG